LPSFLVKNKNKDFLNKIKIKYIYVRGGKKKEKRKKKKKKRKKRKKKKEKKKEKRNIARNFQKKKFPYFSGRILA
jgi:hypothetical protein